jgi:hypothetical protein
MTSEPHLESPARFELDQPGGQPKVSGKTRVSDFVNRIVQFLQIQPSPTARVDDGDRANLHPSDVWVREGKDHG